MATLIKADGTKSKVSPKNKKSFTLAELQKLVGGFIEILRPKGDNEHYLIVNEDGRLKQLRINRRASALYNYDTAIVGDAVYCDKSEIV